MKIQIKQLTLRNFKGARDFKISDLGNEVSISGANATGKTRLFDAFTWLLFSKDSEDRKDFNIKSLDINNEPLHKTDHTVSAILVIDGINQKFERIYREKWVKKRGEENQEFEGHETLYKVNDIPHKQSEYQQKIDSIIPENLFKLLTNPFYFNTLMKWTERRELLFKIAGNIQDNEILTKLPELKEFFNSLNGKSLDEFKREITAKKKLLKEALTDIPSRIDEVSRSIQPDPDYPEVEKQIQSLTGQLTDIDSLIASASKKFEKKNKDNQDKLNKIHELKQKIIRLEFGARETAERAINELRFKKNELQRSAVNFELNVSSFQKLIHTEENAIKSLDAENDKLRSEWTKINEEVLSFAENEFICPACRREFEADDIEARKSQMTANFNNDKSARLKRISDKGKINKSEIERLKTEIRNNQKQIDDLTKDISEKLKEADSITIPDNPIIIQDPQVKTLQDQIAELENSIESVKTLDNSQLISKKYSISLELDELKKQLLIRESNGRFKNRLDELDGQQKILSQQIADLEKQEFQCEKFIHAKINMIEERINGMFSFVRFKMFNTQVNGGLEECCEALIKGVPFPDANNGAKINAGIDIINAFSKHYDVYAPIFTDNAEAINEILKTESQMIKLYVTTDKELKIINN